MVVACSQADSDEDADCVDLSLLPPRFAPSVRRLDLDWRQARGPGFARYLIQRHLFRDEDYFLQLDSHSRVIRGWDSTLIEMLGRCGSLKPVLSTYPLPYEGSGKSVTLSGEEHLTLLCTQPAASAFDADAMLRFRARLLATQLHSPLPSAFWAAGFSFSAGSFAREIPYDPHLPFLFFGEEISMVLRMWTRGWDLFAPDAHVVFHRWARCYRSTFWEIAEGKAIRAHSQLRVRRLLTTDQLDAPLAIGDGQGNAHHPSNSLGSSHHRLGSNPDACTATNTPATTSSDASAPCPSPTKPPPPPPPPPPPLPLALPALSPRLDDSIPPPPPDDPVWALGSVRSLAEYEAFAGVDFGAKEVSSQAERGGMVGEDCFWDRFACLFGMLEEAGGHD